VSRLGVKLKVAVNEDARSSDLIGEIKLDLRAMKEQSTKTQFSYTISNILRVNPCEHHLGGLENCASCHALGTADEHRRAFAQIADGATQKADQLLPCSEMTRHDAPPRKFQPQLRSGVRASMNT